MAEPARVSDVLKSLAQSPQFPQDVQKAIQEGIGHPKPPKASYAHPDCPCIGCMRAYGLVP